MLLVLVELVDVGWAKAFSYNVCWAAGGEQIENRLSKGIFKAYNGMH